MDTFASTVGRAKPLYLQRFGTLVVQNHCILKVSDLPRRQTIIFLALGRPQDRTETVAWTFADTFAERFAETFVGGRLGAFTRPLEGGHGAAPLRSWAKNY